MATAIPPPDLEELNVERLFVLEALAQSNEQVRSLPALVNEARGERAGIKAIDASKLVAATIAVNTRLKDQLADIEKAIRAARIAAERAAELVKKKPAEQKRGGA